jgi:hypothetical protein
VHFSITVGVPGQLLELFAIPNDNAAATALDCTVAFKNMKRVSNRCSPNAQHTTDEIMPHADFIRINPIMTHQQPA